MQSISTWGSCPTTAQSTPSASHIRRDIDANTRRHLDNASCSHRRCKYYCKMKGTKGKIRLYQMLSERLRRHRVRLIGSLTRCLGCSRKPLQTKTSHAQLVAAFRRISSGSCRAWLVECLRPAVSSDKGRSHFVTEDDTLLQHVHSARMQACYSCNCASRLRCASLLGG